jgi:hypothetical protein
MPVSGGLQNPSLQEGLLAPAWSFSVDSFLEHTQQLEVQAPGTDFLVVAARTVPYSLLASQRRDLF